MQKVEPLNVLQNRKEISNPIPFLEGINPLSYFKIYHLLS